MAMVENREELLTEMEIEAAKNLIELSGSASINNSDSASSNNMIISKGGSIGSNQKNSSGCGGENMQMLGIVDECEITSLRQIKKMDDCDEDEDGIDNRGKKKYRSLISLYEETKPIMINCKKKRKKF